MLNAIIFCGLPGSGKSTWANKYLKENKQCALLSKDEIRSMLRGFYDNYEFCAEWEALVKDIATTICKTIVKMGLDIIVDETNITKVHRQYWIDVIHEINKDYKITFVWFTETEKNLDRRVKVSKFKEKSYDDTVETWSRVINMMKDKFEPVENDENFDELLKIDNIAI